MEIRGGRKMMKRRRKGRNNRRVDDKQSKIGLDESSGDRVRNGELTGAVCGH